MNGKTHEKKKKKRSTKKSNQKWNESSSSPLNILYLSQFIYIGIFHHCLRHARRKSDTLHSNKKIPSDTVYIYSNLFHACLICFSLHYFTVARQVVSARYLHDIGIRWNFGNPVELLSQASDGSLLTTAFLWTSYCRCWVQQECRCHQNGEKHCCKAAHQ